MMAASELLLRRVTAARNAWALNSKEDEMKDYSRIDIDTSGRLGMGDFPLGTVAAVASIIGLTVFLLMFLLVSL